MHTIEISKVISAAIARMDGSECACSKAFTYETYRATKLALSLWSRRSCTLWRALTLDVGRWYRAFRGSGFRTGRRVEGTFAILAETAGRPIFPGVATVRAQVTLGLIAILLVRCFLNSLNNSLNVRALAEVHDPEASSAPPRCWCAWFDLRAWRMHISHGEWQFYSLCNADQRLTSPWLEKINCLTSRDDQRSTNCTFDLLIKRICWSSVKVKRFISSDYDNVNFRSTWHKLYNCKVTVNFA